MLLKSQEYLAYNTEHGDNFKGIGRTTFLNTRRPCLGERYNREMGGVSCLFCLRYDADQNQPSFVVILTNKYDSAT